MDFNMDFMPDRKILFQGFAFLFFALLRPVECGAYSSGVSEKQKNINLCALCAFAVI